MERLARLEVKLLRLNAHTRHVNFLRRAAHFNQLVLPQMADRQHQLTLAEQIHVVEFVLFQNVTTGNISAMKHGRLFTLKHTQFTQLVCQGTGIAEMHQKHICGKGLLSIRHNRRQQQFAGLRAITAHIQRTQQRRLRHFWQHQLDTLVELIDN